MERLLNNLKEEAGSPNILNLFDELRSRLVCESRQIQDLQEALRKKEEGAANNTVKMSFLSSEVLRLKKELELEKNRRVEAESKLAQLGRLVLTSVKFSLCGEGAPLQFKEEEQWPKMFERGNLVDMGKLSEVTDVLFDPSGGLLQPDVLAHDDGTIIEKTKGLKMEFGEASAQKSGEASVLKKPQSEDGTAINPTSSGKGKCPNLAYSNLHIARKPLKYGREALLEIGRGQNIARFEVHIPELRRDGPKDIKGMGKGVSTGSGTSIGIPIHELPWARIDKCKVLSKEMLQILKPKIEVVSLGGIRRIFQKNGWNLEERLTVEALTEVICRLTFNPVIGKWMDEKVAKLFITLRNLVDLKMNPVVFEQIDDYGRRKGIGEDEMDRITITMIQAFTLPVTDVIKMIR